MRKDYDIGMETNNVNLKVSIGTPGIAHTIVFQYLPGGGHKKLSESDVNSGNIPSTTIGAGSDLSGSYLKIRTVIDFGTIDNSQWDQLGTTLVGKYSLSGGFDGIQSFEYDENDKTKSNNGKIVIIDKEINFK